MPVQEKSIPIISDFSKSLREPPTVKVPIGSLAHRVHRLESGGASERLAYLFATLRLERNREQLHNNPEAIDDLFAFVDRLYEQWIGVDKNPDESAGEIPNDSP